MKLKNKLLPIVALSGIATVAAPLVSCNNGGDIPEPKESIELKNWTDFESMGSWSVDTGNSDFSIVANQEYSFVVNWDGYTSTTKYNCFQFEVNPRDSGKIIEFKQDLVIAKINGVVLDPYDVSTGTGWLFVEDGSLMCVPEEQISKNVEIVITVKFNESCEECKATGRISNGL